MIILVLVWRKSIHFWRRYARKTIFTFSFPVSLIFDRCYALICNCPLSVKKFTFYIIFTEWSGLITDKGLTDGRGATLNAVPKEGPQEHHAEHLYSTLLGAHSLSHLASHPDLCRPAAFQISIALDCLNKILVSYFIFLADRILTVALMLQCCVCVGDWHVTHNNVINNHHCDKSCSCTVYRQPHDSDSEHWAMQIYDRVLYPSRQFCADDFLEKESLYRLLL